MKNSIKTLTTTEEALLLQHLTKFDGSRVKFCKRLRDTSLILLMLDAGLRVRETVRLAISDVYFNNLPSKSIIIRAEIAKNRQPREIPSSQRLQEALKNYIEYYESLYHGKPESYLFENPTSKSPLTIRQAERIVTNHARAALGKHAYPHILRHTFASKLMRITNARTVQALLGHSSLVSTMIYMHPNGDDLRNAIDSL